MKICPNCKYHNDGNTSVCQGCGADISQVLSVSDENQPQIQPEQPYMQNQPYQQQRPAYSNLSPKSQRSNRTRWWFYGLCALFLISLVLNVYLGVSMANRSANNEAINVIADSSDSSTVPDETKDSESSIEEEIPVSSKEISDIVVDDNAATLINPVPFRTPFVFSVTGYSEEKEKDISINIQITVEGVTRGEEAWEWLQDGSSINDEEDKAPDGKEWALIRVRAQLLETSDSDYEFGSYDSDFVAYDSNGIEMPNQYIFVPTDRFGGKVKVGDVNEGVIALLVTPGDNFVIQYDRFYSLTRSYYFATQ